MYDISCNPTIISPKPGKISRNTDIKEINKRQLYFVSSNTHLSLSQEKDVQLRLKSFLKHGICTAAEIKNKYISGEVPIAPLSSEDLEFAPSIWLAEIDLKKMTSPAKLENYIEMLVHNEMYGIINMSIERNRVAAFNPDKEPFTVAGNSMILLNNKKAFIDEVNQRLLCGLVFITKAPTTKANCKYNNFSKTSGSVIRQLNYKSNIAPDKIIGILAPEPLYNIAVKTFSHISKYIISVPLEKCELKLGAYTACCCICTKEEPNGGYLTSLKVDVPNYSYALNEWSKIAKKFNQEYQHFCTHLTRTSTLSQLSQTPDELVKPLNIKTPFNQMLYINMHTHNRDAEHSKQIAISSTSNTNNIFISKSGDYKNRFAIEYNQALELAKLGKVKLIGKEFCITTDQGNQHNLIFVKTISSNLSKTGDGFGEAAKIKRFAATKLTSEQIEHLVKNEVLITIEQSLNVKQEPILILTCPDIITDKVYKIINQWDEYKLNQASISTKESQMIRHKVLASAMDKFIDKELTKSTDHIKAKLNENKFQEASKLANETTIYAQKFHRDKSLDATTGSQQQPH